MSPSFGRQSTGVRKARYRHYIRRILTRANIKSVIGRYTDKARRWRDVFISPPEAQDGLPGFGIRLRASVGSIDGSGESLRGSMRSVRLSPSTREQLPPTVYGVSSSRAGRRSLEHGGAFAGKVVEARHRMMFRDQRGSERDHWSVPRPAISRQAGTERPSGREDERPPVLPPFADHGLHRLSCSVVGQ
jgi:hypothetical protein